MDAASNYSEELDQYCNDIVVLGQDAVKLYTGTDVEIERDPIMVKILEVFEAF